MTREEVIKYIEECKDDIYGFFICGVSREDIACKCDNRTIAEFDNLTDAKKEEYLSNLADDLGDVYENEHFSEDWNEINFYNLVEMED